mmetsp:Transcript_3259/g.8111  ORF Transcript_3259/g.8111 Transcript_3259/m.8111 type:complete len:253 (-) Transcript_3259:147-905(-)
MSRSPAFTHSTAHPDAPDAHPDVCRTLPDSLRDSTGTSLGAQTGPGESGISGNSERVAPCNENGSGKLEFKRSVCEIRAACCSAATSLEGGSSAQVRSSVPPSGRSDPHTTRYLHLIRISAGWVGGDIGTALIVPSASARSAWHSGEYLAMCSEHSHSGTNGASSIASLSQPECSPWTAPRALTNPTSSACPSRSHAPVLKESASPPPPSLVPAPTPVLSLPARPPKISKEQPISLAVATPSCSRSRLIEAT